MLSQSCSKTVSHNLHSPIASQAYVMHTSTWEHWQVVESTVVRLIHNCISDFCLSSVACISGLDPYISFEPINSIHLITKVYACWIITIYLCISCWVSKCSFSHEFYSTGSSTYQYVEYLAHVQLRSRKNKVSKVSCFNLGGYTY